MNIDQIRKETPGVSDKIFLNSAGSSLVPQSVNERIQSYLTQEALEGGYKLADKHEGEIGEFYVEVAKLLRTSPGNIAYMTSATDAYAKALSAFKFQPGDKILTTDDDYVSNYLHFLALGKELGVEVVRIKNDENFDLDLDHCEEMINKEKPKLVSVTHIPTSSGLVQNVAGVGQLCKKYDIPYLVDACQSIGQLPIDVNEIQCDFLSVTGRKFLRGPRGTGFLYVSDKMLNRNYAPQYIDLAGASWENSEHYKLVDSAKRFELWEINYGLLLGFKEAIKYLNNLGIENVFEYNRKLSSFFRTNLENIPGVNVFDKGENPSNIITLDKTNVPLEKFKHNLDQNRVYYSVTVKEFAQIDFAKKGIAWALRLSPHYFNTKEELETVIDIIDGL